MKTQTADRIKLIKGLYDAISRGEFAPVRDALDPNVEWIEPYAPGLWFSGTHHGAEAVWKDVIEPTLQRVDKFRIHMKTFHALGEHIIAIGYCRGHAKMTGKELEAATAHVCTFSHGKIARLESFHDTESMLGALTLVEPAVHRMPA
jgi:uncharacterized protein